MNKKTGKPGLILPRNNLIKYDNNLQRLHKAIVLSRQPDNA